MEAQPSEEASKPKKTKKKQEDVLPDGVFRGLTPEELVFTYFFMKNKFNTYDDVLKRGVYPTGITTPFGSAVQTDTELTKEQRNALVNAPFYVTGKLMLERLKPVVEDILEAYPELHLEEDYNVKNVKV